jgi:plasmid stabilization system protein ParE
MKPVVFDESARDEYREAIRYYHHIDPALRTGFRAEFRDLVTVIQSTPLLFNIRKHGVRRANLKRFSLYYIAYMLWKGVIVIVAVGHASKRPYYWRRRPKSYRDSH